MRNSRNAGITLVELLVSMTLLSLLSVAILFAYRGGLTAMSKTKERLHANRRGVGVERILTSQIAGFVAAKADCRATPDAPIQRLPFFQGEPQTMRFVSTYSLQEGSRGYPRILELQVIAGENGNGVRLVVNELLYTGPLSAGMLCTGLQSDPASGATSVIYRPVQIGPASFVLADKLAQCTFAYREDFEHPQPSQWRPRWLRDITPAAVRIDMIPLEPDPSKLYVPPFVARFHPNRHAMQNFMDLQ